MKKKASPSEEEQAFFRQLITGTRIIQPDTVVHPPTRKKETEAPLKRVLQEQADIIHSFSA